MNNVKGMGSRIFNFVSCVFKSRYRLINYRGDLQKKSDGQISDISLKT